MDKTERKIDVFSLIIGVLISLAAQGIYDIIFYYATGRIFEELVVIVITFMIIFLIVSIVLAWTTLKAIKEKQRTPHIG
jgi:divalent metal cation (Fe/Co/Zn/Cd) transporter